MVTKLWKYPLIKTCIAGAVGYLTFGIVDSLDSTPILDKSEKWRKFRSDFYEYYFKIAGFVGKRQYIEEPYRQNVPSGSYLSFDSDDRLRKRILRKAHRYAIKAATIEKDEDLRADTYKWHGLIILKRSKYGNKEKRLLKAISELEKALVVDSTDPQIWYYIGIAKHELGEHQQAVDCYLRVKKLKQTDCPQTDYHLGLALKQLNTPKSRVDACSAFKQVLTKHCNSVADAVVRIKVRRAAIREIRECEEHL
uniref:Uncharacterized protein n=1 Tax=Setaria digitata TaxID=48799 RepID=A0A915PHH0_9BILA